MPEKTEYPRTVFGILFDQIEHRDSQFSGLSRTEQADRIGAPVYPNGLAPDALDATDIRHYRTGERLVPDRVARWVVRYYKHCGIDVLIPSWEVEGGSTISNRSSIRKTSLLLRSLADAQGEAVPTPAEPQGDALEAYIANEVALRRQQIEQEIERRLTDELVG